MRWGKWFLFFDDDGRQEPASVPVVLPSITQLVQATVFFVPNYGAMVEMAATLAVSTEFAKSRPYEAGF